VGDSHSEWLRQRSDVVVAWNSCGFGIELIHSAITTYLGPGRCSHERFPSFFLPNLGLVLLTRCVQMSSYLEAMRTFMTFFHYE
jgi:hypothetical protein